MEDGEIKNITCSAFAAMSEVEQRAFIVGVANGRGMTSGLYRAYAGAAKKLAATSAEGDAIAMSFEKVDAMVLPLLSIDAVSLLNGVKAACKRPEYKDELIINSLASMHLDAARALRDDRKKSSL